MIKRFGKKALVFCFLSLGVAFGLHAQNAVKMTESDGTETFFLLTATPKVAMNGNTLSVSTSESEITCEVGEGVTFEFCDYEPGAVETIETSAPAFKLTTDHLEAYNLKPSTSVVIYDITGKMLKSSTTDDTGNAVINIADLPAGIYVVNSNSNNFKFYKK